MAAKSLAKGSASDRPRSTIFHLLKFVIWVTGPLGSLGFLFFLFCVIKYVLFVLVASEPVFGGDLFCSGLLDCFVFVFLLCLQPSTDIVERRLSVFSFHIASLFCEIINSKNWQQNLNLKQPNPVELNPPNSKKYYILYFRMVLYAFSHSYIPWQPLARDFKSAQNSD